MTEAPLVVQFDGDGALLDLTYTSYDEAGDLNYGVSGAGTFSQDPAPFFTAIATALCGPTSTLKRRQAPEPRLVGQRVL